MLSTSIDFDGIADIEWIYDPAEVDLLLKPSTPARRWRSFVSGWRKSRECSCPESTRDGKSMVFTCETSRTFITNAGRKISTVGGSLRDVQLLAGHTNLRTTQRYIEPNAEAQVRVVGLYNGPGSPNEFGQGVRFDVS
jgi:hypothetical protein